MSEQGLTNTSLQELANLILTGCTHWEALQKMREMNWEVFNQLDLIDYMQWDRDFNAEVATVFVNCGVPLLHKALALADQDQDVDGIQHWLRHRANALEAHYSGSTTLKNSERGALTQVADDYRREADRLPQLLKNTAPIKDRWDVWRGHFVEPEFDGVTVRVSLTASARLNYDCLVKSGATEEVKDYEGEIAGDLLYHHNVARDGTFSGTISFQILPRPVGERSRRGPNAPKDLAEPAIYSCSDKALLLAKLEALLASVTLAYAGSARRGLLPDLSRHLHADPDDRHGWNGMTPREVVSLHKTGLISFRGGLRSAAIDDEHATTTGPKIVYDFAGDPNLPQNYAGILQGERRELYFNGVMVPFKAFKYLPQVSEGTIGFRRGDDYIWFIRDFGRVVDKWRAGKIEYDDLTKDQQTAIDCHCAGKPCPFPYLEERSGIYIGEDLELHKANNQWDHDPDGRFFPWKKWGCAPWQRANVDDTQQERNSEEAS